MLSWSGGNLQEQPRDSYHSGASLALVIAVPHGRPSQATFIGTRHPPPSVFKRVWLRRFVAETPGLRLGVTFTFLRRLIFNGAT